MKTIVLAAAMLAVVTPALAGGPCMAIPGYEAQVAAIEESLVAELEQRNPNDIRLHRWRMMAGRAPHLASAYYLLGMLDGESANSRAARNLQGELQALSGMYRNCFGGMY